jgi:hypothetical protein
VWSSACGSQKDAVVSMTTHFQYVAHVHRCVQIGIRNLILEEFLSVLTVLRRALFFFFYCELMIQYFLRLVNCYSAVQEIPVNGNKNLMILQKPALNPAFTCIVTVYFSASLVIELYIVAFTHLALGW